MQRYKSKYGTTYEIEGSKDESVLSKVITETKTVMSKPVTNEHKQTYLRGSRESCFDYMLQVDRFNLNEQEKEKYYGY